jgi:hypothetical protein
MSSIEGFCGPERLSQIGTIKNEMEPVHELEWCCGPKSLESANGFASMNVLWVGTCQGDSEPGQLSSRDIG